MSLPFLANASDIVAWADTHAAREQLPELIRRLVLATVHPPPSFLEMRANEGVGLPGWDGRVECETGNTFVPSGASGWEMGVTADVGAKITGDFRKRTKAPAPVDPAISTFVFVTPRRWGGRETWLKETRKTSPWQGLRVFDADDLAAWLATAPGVHLWFSALIGKPATGAQSLEAWWMSWRAMTTPPMTEGLLLSGRTVPSDTLKSELTSDPHLITVRAETPEDATAFVAAVLSANAEEAVRARAVLVHTAAAWTYLSAHPEPLVLIPYGFRDAQLWGPTIRNGHHVILPVGTEERMSITVDVPRIAAHEAHEVLRAEGLSSPEATYAAGTLRRSLTAYRRIFASGDAPLPSWATLMNRELLGALALLGSWREDRGSDREIVERLAGRPYSDVNSILLQLAAPGDAPFRLTGAVWRVNEKEDAWRVTASTVSADRVRAFLDLARDVLSSAPCSPNDDDPLQSLIGSNQREYTHSPALRESVADTLAMLSALGDSGHHDALPSYAGHVYQVVRSLLTHATETPSAWIDLSSYLPDLAEAAPDEFLRILEGDLGKETPSLLALYEGQPGYLSTNYEYPHLLWALERLAWSPAHVVRVILVTARLDAIAPKAEILNSAFETLKSFFRLWLPQCGADPETRWVALDRMRRQVPDVAWRLMLSLLPQGHDHASVNSGPGARAHRYRNWPTQATPVTNLEWYEGVKALSERLIRDADARPERWLELGPEIPSLAHEHQETAFQKLTEFVPQFDETTKLALWNTLRDLVSTHKSFPDAEWCWPESILSLYEALIQTLEPKEAATRSLWLFTQNPEVDEPYSAESSKLPSLRLKAIRAIIEDKTVNHLDGFVHSVESPETIGETLARMLVSPDEVSWIVQGFNSDDARQGLARGFLWVKSRSDPDGNWVHTHLSASVMADWSDEARVTALQALPFSRQVQELLDSLPETTQTCFWQRFNAFWSHGSDNDIMLDAVEALLAHRRPRRALYLLSAAQHHQVAPPVALVQHALEDAMIVPLEEDDTRLEPYRISTLLDWLESNTTNNDDILARLELGYIPIFRNRRSIPALNRRMVETPGLFLELVGLLFKNDDGESSSTDQQGWQRAHLVHQSMRLPGMADDGLDADVFRRWIDAVLPLLSEAKLSRGGRLALGEMFVRGPAAQDNVWPAPAISDVVEEIASDELDLELRVAIYNSRGVTSRSAYAGGDLEREEAKKYDAYARRMEARWPRVAAIHRSLRDGYLAEARRHDLDASLDQDRYGG